MDWELDVFNVGQKSKSGDAITFRYGDFDSGRQIVGVVDGGFEETGDRICDHITTHYDASHIDLVVATHPDSDHVSGLRRVLNQIRVNQLWMHRPWIYDARMAAYAAAQSSHQGMLKPLHASVRQARELEDIAAENDVSIVEPFTGITSNDGRVRVLGPTSDYYLSLLPQFEKSSSIRLFEKATTMAREAAARVTESWGGEALVDPSDGAVTAKNNSSVVLSLHFDAEKVLLTGDAGTPALSRALDYFDDLGEEFYASLLQAPHHGAKRNLGPTILNRLLGQPGPEGHESGINMFISAAIEGAPHHPSRRVVNAVLRRGARVNATRDQTLYYWGTLTSPRWGWTDPAPTETFMPSYIEEPD